MLNDGELSNNQINKNNYSNNVDDVCENRKMVKVEWMSSIW